MNRYIRKLVLIGTSLLFTLSLGVYFNTNNTNASMIYEDQYPSHFNRLIPGGSANHNFYKHGYLFHAKRVLDGPGAITGIDSDYNVSKNQVKHALEGKRIFHYHMRRNHHHMKKERHYVRSRLQKYPNWLRNHYWLRIYKGLTTGNIYSNNDFRDNVGPIKVHIKYLNKNKVIVSFTRHHHDILKQYIKRLSKGRIYIRNLINIEAKHHRDKGTGIYYNVFKSTYKSATNKK